ncbi:hypothetical protein HMPREF0653_02831, partial [Prevotella disiens JCM 6334 = ATCC 29426]
MKVTALMSAFGNLGIDAHALSATLGAAIGGIRLLFGSQQEEFLADGTNVGVNALCKL